MVSMFGTEMWQLSIEITKYDFMSQMVVLSISCWPQTGKSSESTFGITKEVYYQRTLKD